MDFDRGGELAMLLDDFMVELNLYACDLDFRSSVKYTYERDDCLAHSWLDHIICSRDISHLISNVHTVHSGSNCSDHFPLFFHILTSCLSISSSNSITHNVQRVHIDWSKVSPDDVDI